MQAERDGIECCAKATFKAICREFDKMIKTRNNIIRVMKGDIQSKFVLQIFIHEDGIYFCLKGKPVAKTNRIVYTQDVREQCASILKEKLKGVGIIFETCIDEPYIKGTHLYQATLELEKCEDDSEV